MHRVLKKQPIMQQAAAARAAAKAALAAKARARKKRLELEGAENPEEASGEVLAR